MNSRWILDHFRACRSTAYLWRDEAYNPRICQEHWLVSSKHWGATERPADRVLISYGVHRVYTIFGRIVSRRFDGIPTEPGVVAMLVSLGGVHRLHRNGSQRWYSRNTLKLSYNGRRYKRHVRVTTNGRGKYGKCGWWYHIPLTG